MSRIAPQWSRIKKIENTNLEYDNLEKISDVRFSNDTLSTNLTSHIKSKANAIDEVEFSNRHLIEKYKAENNNLENNMKFIKTKHSEMLILLQNEIDTLKNRNKDLQVRLLILSKTPNDSLVSKSKQNYYDNPLLSKGSKSDSTCNDENDKKIRILKNEIQNLKSKIKESNNDKILQKSTKIVKNSPSTETNFWIPKGVEIDPLCIIEEGLRRKITSSETNVLVKNLCETCSHLQKKLAKINYDLNEAIYSNKWTPDAFLMAKKYVEFNNTSVIPNGLSNKTDFKLPPLKCTIGNKVADRQRKKFYLRKTRLNKFDNT